MPKKDLPSHRLLEKRIGKYTWYYYDIGKGPQTLVIFPDIMGTAESWFAYTPFLTKKYRVIIPLYPHISSAKSMTESLHLFLAHCSVKECSLIGSSFGGLLAQVYIRKYPQQIKRLILIATGTSNRLYGFLVMLLRIIGSLSPAAFPPLFAQTAAIHSLDVAKAKKIFWKKYLQKTIWKIDTKQALLSWGKCIMDICLHYTFKSADFMQSPFPILLITSTEDIVFPFFVRSNLKKNYPSAQIITLPHAKHLIGINRFPEVKKQLEEFLL